MLIKLGIDKIQYERISVRVKFDSINLSIFPIISTIKNNSVKPIIKKMNFDIKFLVMYMFNKLIFIKVI